MPAPIRHASGSPILALLALGLIAAGCDNPGITAPARSAAPAFDRAAQPPQVTGQRPLTGRCVTSFPPVAPPLPPVLHQEDTGTCQLTLLGRSTYFSAKDIDFAAGTQTTTELRLTAPNGDVLRGAGAGTNSPGEPGHVNFTAEITFNGGTGRFEHATGHASIAGAADLAAHSSSLTLQGWITYDPADRSGR